MLFTGVLLSLYLITELGQLNLKYKKPRLSLHRNFLAKWSERFKCVFKQHVILGESIMKNINPVMFTRSFFLPNAEYLTKF